MSAFVFTNTQGAVTNLQDDNIITSKITGVENAPNAQLSTANIIRQDGDKVIASAYAPRSIGIEGVVTDTTPTALRTRLNNIKRDVAGAGTLDVTLDGDTIRRYTVNVINFAIPNEPYQVTWVPFSIGLEAHDPPFGEDLTSIVGISVGNNSANVTGTTIFGGSAPPNIEAQLTVNTPGNLAAVEIRNNTTATSLEVAPAAWSAGDVLSYKSGPGALLLNGLPQDFTGVLPKFIPGSNDWAVNYRTATVTIDRSQLVYNSDKFAFGNTWLAQSFQASGSIAGSRLDLLISKTGSPTQVQVQIRTDNAGAPSSTVVSNSTIVVPGTNVNVLTSYVAFNLPGAVILSAATTYWIVVQATGAVSDINNGFYWKGSNTNPYAGGNASRSVNAGSTWVADTSYDQTFKLWKTTLVAASTDTSTETYTENYSTTTYKDGVATTAYWDTASGRLTLGLG